MNDQTRIMIVAAIRGKTLISEGREKLPCAVAFSIADEFGIGRREIGDICNSEGIRIISCQLGCFP
jgi:hypothetical protein